MNVKGTQTEKNLMKAFAGESQARNRYTFFASKAKDEGHVAVAAIFEETANQEKEHAKRFFKFLQGGEVEITDKFPAGVIGSTEENLKAAAGGEHHEWSDLYPYFAKVAREEGFEGIAKVFEAISVAEKHHEERYLNLLSQLQGGTEFKRGQSVKWKCLNCAYIAEGAEAPKACPACAHPQAYFEVLKQ